MLPVHEILREDLDQQSEVGDDLSDSNSGALSICLLARSACAARVVLSTRL